MGFIYFKAILLSTLYYISLRESSNLLSELEDFHILAERLMYNPSTTQGKMEPFIGFL